MAAAIYPFEPALRERWLEFLGGRSIDDATALFISTDANGAYAWYNPLPIRDLDELAQSGAEIARSLWDRDSLIADLDMEYVNFDDPTEPFFNAERSFSIQRPVVEAAEELFISYGIAPLHLLSGRGHHFVWRIDRGATACGRLAMLGRMPSTIAAKYAQPQPPSGEVVPLDLGAAFAGLALVMEHFAHRLLASSIGRCEIPIELTAVEVGPIQRGREIVSVDLSEYGDPLHTRTLRMPFSAYLKERHYRASANGRPHAPPRFTIPLHEMDERQALQVMKDADQICALARRASTQIPEQSRGMEALIADYEQSSLARFHDYFYESEHDPPERWSQTYDRTPLSPLPTCVSYILQNPNDLLLKPAGIQHVARTLLAVGWHPRHIAGLIRSKYERNYHWVPGWSVYDAAFRADFYTRLFTGLFAAGLDPLIDYNCRSTTEKGYCFWTGCGEILEQHRLRLENRRDELHRITAGNERRKAAEAPS